MNKLILLLLLLSPFTLLSQNTGSYRPVDDAADLLSPEAETMLTAIATQWQQKTSNQIVLITVNSVGENNMSDYAQQLFNSRGIGEKGKDNGVLILVAKNEQKVRIHTGYGLEQALPDLFCKDLIENLIYPEFKKADYAKGLSIALDKIIEKVGNEPFTSNSAEKKEIEKEKDFDLSSTDIFILVLFLLFLLAFTIWRIVSVGKKITDHPVKWEDGIIALLVTTIVLDALVTMGITALFYFLAPDLLHAQAGLIIGLTALLVGGLIVVIYERSGNLYFLLTAKASVTSSGGTVGSSGATTSTKTGESNNTFGENSGGGNNNTGGGESGGGGSEGKW